MTMMMMMTAFLMGTMAMMATMTTPQHRIRLSSLSMHSMRRERNCRTCPWTDRRPKSRPLHPHCQHEHFLSCLEVCGPWSISPRQLPTPSCRHPKSRTGSAVGSCFGDCPERRRGKTTKRDKSHNSGTNIQRQEKLHYSGKPDNPVSRRGGSLKGMD